MHQDFITALWKNEPLKIVYDRLSEQLDKEWQKERSKLYEDYNEAKHVLYSLRQPADSFMHKWAISFVSEAKQKEKNKDQDRLEFEERRRTVEQEVYQLREEEAERLKQNRIRANQERAKSLTS